MRAWHEGTGPNHAFGSRRSRGSDDEVRDAIEKHWPPLNNHQVKATNHLFEHPPAPAVAGKRKEDMLPVMIGPMLSYQPTTAMSTTKNQKKKATRIKKAKNTGNSTVLKITSGIIPPPAPPPTHMQLPSPMQLQAPYHSEILNPLPSQREPQDAGIPTGKTTGLIPPPTPRPVHKQLPSHMQLQASLHPERSHPLPSLHEPPQYKKAVVIDLTQDCLGSVPLSSNSNEPDSGLSATQVPLPSSYICQRCNIQGS